MSTVLGAVDLANGGAAIRVSFIARPAADSGNPGALIPTLDALPERESRESLVLARSYTASVLGWPRRHDVHWSWASVDGRVLPAMRGPSLFGVFCLGLMQLVAVEEPDAVHSWSRDRIDLVRAVPLDRVAVSTSFDPTSGRFACVGKIASKLAALAQLGANVCSLCVVAPKQLEGKVTPLDVETASAMFTTALGPDIVVLEAASPMDTFDKLSKLEALAVASRLRP